ncbi:MAG: TolC family protein [Bacteroidales bacterium]|nr:MAG: TolC family protein [Bacteroidales bacterium]
MNVRTIITATLLAVSTTLSAQEELNRYLELAAERSPALKAKFNEYMAALEVVPQAGALPDPQLAFGYFIRPVETRIGPQQAKVSLTQMFPWFGTLGAREDVAVQNARSKYEAFQEAKSNLFFEVQAAWYDMYFISKAIVAITDNIRIMETFKNLALIKVGAGTASGVDELRAEMELADLENNLAFMKDNWNIHKVKLNNLVNIPEESPVTVPDTLWTTDLVLSREAILDTLRSNNHQVLSLDYLLETYRSKEVLARKSGLPDLSIGIDYVAVGKSANPVAENALNGRDAILFPKIGITIPLYRKKYRAMVNEAVYMQQATGNKKADKINMLESVFEKVYSEYLDADRKINLYRKQIRIAEKAINILESEYAGSGKNFEEILRMERRLLEYSLELEKSRSDKQASVAFINYLMGN